MKRLSILALILFGLLAGPGVAPAHATGARDYVVQPGDTLTGIAARHRVSVSQLARTNGQRWNSWVYVGQRLTIPGSTSGSSQPSGSGTYTVRPGDTLTCIAVSHGVSVSQLAQANGQHWNSWVYVGQRLVIPGRPAAPAASPSPQTVDDERWIDVDLTAQRLTAYEGSSPVYNALVSTGLPQTPTVVGQFRIWVKFAHDDMEGPGYYLPDVPYVMYFYRGYGLHGTYWHDNFGTPMSHGCVNISNGDAEWLFNWASVGTKVVTHY